MGIHKGLRIVTLVSALAVTGCGPLILGAGVAAGLRGLAERSTEQVASDTRTRVGANVALSERAGDLYTTLGIEVYEGRLLLTGVVPTEEDRIRVGEIVSTVENVKEVLNEVQIGEPSGIADYSQDVGIASLIRLRLIEHDKTAQALDMEFEVVNRVVYVIGRSASDTARRELAEVMRTTAGVKTVVLHLQVDGSPSSRDLNHVLTPPVPVDLPLSRPVVDY